MNNNLIQVEEFDLAAIKAAFRDGRLYIRPSVKSAQELREDGIRAIMEYVSRIDECASDAYRPHIRELWCRILRNEVMTHLFFIAKGKHRNEPNWYRVTNVVCSLRERDVYRKAEFSSLDLHKILEQTARKNGRYTGSTAYYLEHRELMVLKRIIQEFQR